MIQLIQPNLGVVGRIGYCLEYAENVCGAPHLEPNAYIAGQNTQFKHFDSNFPTDAICVQWYEYWLGGERLDHVTINVPGQGIYSSPWQQGTTHAVLPSVAEVERIYGVKYLFWSEDISSLRIVQGVTMPSAQDVDDYILAWTGVPATAKQIADYTSQGWRILTDDILKFVTDQSNAQLATLQASVDQLTAANQKLVDQLQALKVTPVVTDPSVTVTQSGLWAAFKRFLGL